LKHFKDPPELQPVFDENGEIIPDKVRYWDLTSYGILRILKLILTKD
jgi:hypothetical protein